MPLSFVRNDCDRETTAKQGGSVVGQPQDAELSIGTRSDCVNLTQRATIAPHIAIDETVLAVMRFRQPRVPSIAAADQTATEIAQAAAFFTERGWSARPATYHRTPPTLIDSDVSSGAPTPGR